jgi:hypothetical protein
MNERDHGGHAAMGRRDAERNADAAAAAAMPINTEPGPRSPLQQPRDPSLLRRLFPVNPAMGCQRCGGRMLSRVRGHKDLLICSDCAAPVASGQGPGEAVGRQAGLLLVAMAAFVLLVLFLTSLNRIGINPAPGDVPSEKVTGGETESGSRP